MLIHMDGFDHYGDDETKMTEGVYDQVDADFSLSSVNPRTGVYSLRRNNSASDSYVVKSLGVDYTCIGAGFCIYIDQLPSQDSAYPVIEFLYNDTQHVTLIIQNDGAIYIKYGGLNGAIIATSEPNIITSGEFSHIEMAACVDSFEGLISTTTTIGRKENWKYLVENRFSTNDYSDPDFDDSSWSTSSAPFMHQTPHPYLPDLGWTNTGGTEIGAENLVWMRKTIILTFSSTVTFNIAFDNSPTLYVDGVSIAIDIGEVVPGQPQAWIGTATVDLSSGSHVIAYKVVESGPDLPTNYFYADLEMLSEASNTDINGGIIEVRKNGVTVISKSNALTTSSQDKFYNKVRLLCGSSNAHGVTADIDDYYIWNDQGSWNNTFLGDRRCFLIKPNQDTNVADFEPSSGSFGYKMIDDESPDDDSTYIIAEAYLQSGSPLSGTSEFEIENLPDGASLISGINVITRSAKTDSTSAEIYTSVNSGADSLSGIAHTLTTSYRYYNDIYEYDPKFISNLTKIGFNDLSISVTADDLGIGPSIESPDVISPDIVSPSIVSPTPVNTYADEVLSDNPVGYWRLGESSGSVMSDSSTNGLDGTYTSVTLGTTGLISGDSDTAVTFNGSNSHADVPDNALLDVIDISVDAWIKTSSTSAVQQIVSRDGSADPRRQFQFRIDNTTGHLRVIIFSEGGAVQINDTYTGASLSDGLKHHVGFSYDSTTFECKWYVDGANVKTATGGAALDPTHTWPLTIGAINNAPSTWTNFFNGVIDEVALYDSVLGDARFLAHYNKGA